MVVEVCFKSKKNGWWVVYRMVVTKVNLPMLIRSERPYSLYAKPECKTQFEADWITPYSCYWTQSYESSSSLAQPLSLYKALYISDGWTSDWTLPSKLLGNWKSKKGETGNWNLRKIRVTRSSPLSVLNIGQLHCHDRKLKLRNRPSTKIQNSLVTKLIHHRHHLHVSGSREQAQKLYRDIDLIHLSMSGCI